MLGNPIKTGNAHSTSAEPHFNGFNQRCFDICCCDAMVSIMRSTVRIDDDLMMELKERARRENVSQTRMLNRLLREGIKASRGGRAKKSLYQETTVAMGTPRVDLDKALALAADFDDEEMLRKMALRK
jgi:hypothetical protein